MKEDFTNESSSHRSGPSTDWRTASLSAALEHLLGVRCYHMSVIPGYPFDPGPDWDLALAGGEPNWDEVFKGFSAAVDWPASMLWKELREF